MIPRYALKTLAAFKTNGIRTTNLRLKNISRLINSQNTIIYPSSRFFSNLPDEIKPNESKPVAISFDYIRKNYIENLNTELLEDFSKWLDGIGLGKHAPKFEGKSWKRIIHMRYEDMEDIGIDSAYDRHTLRRYLNYARKALENGGVSPINFELLKDFPAWLESVGFGNYAPNFANRQYQEIIEMMYEDLEALGIRNKGDRHALRRYFDDIRAALADKRRIEGDIIPPPDYALLENIPAWFESIGMKSLVPLFLGKRWQDIVEMNHDDLIKLGIGNKNLRYSLMRNFWFVKRCVAKDTGQEIPPFSIKVIKERGTQPNYKRSNMNL
ncbi:12716_t:CDS:2 [Acaulospora morrowiae]|uniref:12716_t:CDS:1 n=1 Tax=Acaulospora morrowiae TaxID=94023 RepID=A0A9N8V299_9GLOM|nr:12716_t:CDS:2 [Acaulospora morrowiae]